MPRCEALLPAGTTYCPAHAPKQAYGWNNDDGRIRGRKLQQLRRDLYAREPFCRLCHVGLTMRPNADNSLIRDHIVPLTEHGTDELTNIQPLCRLCSDTKTQAESVRGRGGVART
jgi:5-methylcytosine-specific restriction protein A